jgi:protocatechuate 3,4-dioxygenase beta subunit
MSERPSDNPGLTVPAGPGPFYVSGAPELADGELNYTRLPGERIALVGHVYAGPDTSTPIPGAKVEIWQADSSGNYHPNASGDASVFAAGVVGLRGYVLADAAGAYRFVTIYPGSYPGRTRHLHVRATAEGFAGVVTQILVPARPGDYSSIGDDPIARALPPANQVVFTVEEGIPLAHFDFHLGRR